MKYHRFSKVAAVLGLCAAALLPAAAPASEIVSSSFGGGAVSGSANWTTIGSFHCIGGKPAITPDASDFIQSGPHAVQFPMIMTEPKVYLLSSGPGMVSLVCVPDLPGREWHTSDDLTSWSFLADSSENPLVMEVDAAKRFFRLEDPE